MNCSVDEKGLHVVRSCMMREHVTDNQE